MKPRPGWALIRRVPDPDAINGIEVPDIAKNRKLGPSTAYQAEVIAVGSPGYRYEPNAKVKRRWCEPDFKPGMSVLVEAMSYYPVGDDCELVRCWDVIATLHGADVSPVCLMGHQPYLGKGAEQAEQAKLELDRERQRRRDMGRRVMI